jgi:DNA processing protein
MQDPLFAQLFLHSLPDVGPATYTRLVEHFGSAELALLQSNSMPESFLKPAAIAILEKFHNYPESCASSQKAIADIEWLNKQSKVKLLTLEDPAYPKLLRQTAKAPPLLFVQGNLDCLHFPQIAIVGSRHPSVGGLENAHRFAHHLAANGFTITSGLALGVDAAAHEGALAGLGKTIAVMGTGLDKIYPTRHYSLAQRILENDGALVSEFPLGLGAHPSNFPQRNRIISGLSCGVLVVEAAIQSGSLITAKIALEQNREVFSIPGSIHNPLARGCHQLIRQGATLTETAQDIVDQLQGILSYQRHELATINTSAMKQQKTKVIEENNKQDLTSLSAEERNLVTIMGFDPVAIDDLVERTGIPVGSLTAQLIGLEIKGFVEQRGASFQRV